MFVASFLPTPAPDYATVEQRTDVDAATLAVLDEMIGAFRGDPPARRPFQQLPRMGRACFLPVSPPGAGYVAPKGSLGRSPGSESVRRLQDRRWRSLFGDGGGCARVEIDADTDFLVSYRPVDGDRGMEMIELIEAVPEGYSRFSTLLREYRSLRDVYEPLKVRAPSALALSRRTQVLPWSTEEDAKRYLNARFRAQLPPARQGVGLKDGPLYKPYTDLDSGLLWRHFRAAVRPQDYYDLALADDWDTLEADRPSLRTCASRNLTHWAEASGRLLQHGIIHGQLYYDYQNITIAGEICDAEMTAVAPSVNHELATKFSLTLRRDEDRFGIELVGPYEEKLARMAPDWPTAAKSLMEQAYYLWDAALRCVDISRRSADDGATPGTVLSAVEVERLRRRFAATMVENLREDGRRVAATACRAQVDIDTDFRTPVEPPQLRLVLDRGLATIRGWTSPSRPFNHFTHRVTEADIEFVVADYHTFTRAVSEELQNPNPSNHPT